MAYIYTYKFTYIVLAERGVLDDPPNPPGYGPAVCVCVCGWGGGALPPLPCRH